MELPEDIQGILYLICATLINVLKFAHWRFNLINLNQFVYHVLIWFLAILNLLSEFIILVVFCTFILGLGLQLVFSSETSIHSKLFIHIQRLKVKLCLQYRFIALNLAYLLNLFFMHFRIQCEQYHIYLVFQYRVGNHVLKEIALDICLLHVDLIELQQLVHNAIYEVLYLFLQYFHIILDELLPSFFG